MVKINYKKLFALGSLIVGAGCVHAQTQPNVLIILADDQGWGDVGFNGCTDIPTPNLDRLAESGVSFQCGYATHPYCSPSRAGLLTGRYQAHFGHESNVPVGEGTENDGLPLNQLMISELLHQHGYQTCAIGKWHLGDSKKFWPTNRGFDDWYGFTGGSRSYFDFKHSRTPEHIIRRNGVPIPQNEISYLTDDFTKAAVDYIDKYSKNGKPFFMYLAYNAPHAPNQATREYLDKMKHQENGERAVYGAMVTGMDKGIGEVISKLKENGEYDNTLIFYYSDNGGSHNGASNGPFRGHKGMLFEGGIREPFLISWPKVIRGGVRYQKPISALDIYPTILDAAHISYPKKGVLDGVDLIPYLQGDKQNEMPNDLLFWRYSDGLGYAVRKGDYKMVKSGYKQKFLLFNLVNDPYEMHDLAEKMPEKLNELKELYANWNKQNIPMKWRDLHPEHVRSEEAARDAIINKSCAGERKKISK